VWPGPDGEGSPVPLSNPALFSFPIGFLCCWLGTVMSRERNERAYHELKVRAETGIGAY
jgi:cation/acetate symporter